MEKFNEAVIGLKEGKQEMSKQIQDLATSIDSLLTKIKVTYVSLAYCYALETTHFVWF